MFSLVCWLFTSTLPLLLVSGPITKYFCLSWVWACRHSKHPLPRSFLTRQSLSGSERRASSQDGEVCDSSEFVSHCSAAIIFVVVNRRWEARNRAVNTVVFPGVQRASCINTQTLKCPENTVQRDTIYQTTPNTSDGFIKAVAALNTHVGSNPNQRIIQRTKNRRSSKTASTRPDLVAVLVQWFVFSLHS